MERKTAISVLKDIKNWAEKDKRIVYVEALTIAINSLMTDEAYQLEYERTTKNDLGVDCISRQAVLDGFEKYSKGSFGYGCVWDYVKNLPSVTLIRPKGHWISHGEHCRNLGVIPSGLGAYEWCSNCDCGIDVREWHRNHYNFCPNCGADMREVEE